MHSLSILCYHRILAEADRHGAGRPYFLRGTAISEDNFAAQMRSVVEHFDVLTEGEVLEWLDGKRALHRRSCWITFDDGYRDVVERAEPVLSQHHLPATAFVTTGVVTDPGSWLPGDRWYATLDRATRDRGSLSTGGSRWHFDLSVAADYARLVDGPERRRYLIAPPPEQASLLQNLAETLDSRPLAHADLYMTPMLLKQLVAAGWSIGGHGHEHRILANTAGKDRVVELRTPGTLLEANGFSPRVFAYPDGVCDRDLAAMARDEGWAAAVTLGNHVAARADRHALARFVARDDPNWIARLIAPS